MLRFDLETFLFGTAIAPTSARRGRSHRARFSCNCRSAANGSLRRLAPAPAGHRAPRRSTAPRAFGAGARAGMDRAHRAELLGQRLAEIDPRGRPTARLAPRPGRSTPCRVRAAATGGVDRPIAPLEGLAERCAGTGSRLTTHACTTVGLEPPVKPDLPPVGAAIQAAGAAQPRQLQEIEAARQSGQLGRIGLHLERDPAFRPAVRR